MWQDPRDSDDCGGNNNNSNMWQFTVMPGTALSTAPRLTHLIPQQLQEVGTITIPIIETKKMKRNITKLVELEFKPRQSGSRFLLTPHYTDNNNA